MDGRGLHEYSANAANAAHIANTDTMPARQPKPPFPRGLSSPREAPLSVGSASFSFGASCHATVREGVRPGDVAAYLEGRGHRDIGVCPIAATIEDCFMALMNKHDEL